MMTKFNLLAVAAAGLVLAGCSSTPTEEGTDTTTVPVTPVVSTPVVGDTADAAIASVVYFDFDHDQVRSEYMSVIQAQANKLKASGQTVTLEGHCDERGSREYNLGLGERRAKTVAAILKANGVAADRIRLVSFGEDRPAVEGSHEAAWSKNRRVEFNVQ